MTQLVRCASWMAFAAYAVAQTPPPPPAAPPAAAVKAEQPGGPRKEILRFEIRNASGLELGEIELSAAPANGADAWEFVLQAQAAIPQFPVAEWTRAAATGLCTTESEKKAVRGKRRIDEKTTFDQRTLKATRETAKGGSSELTIPPCARDALTYLYHLRKELALGRLPQVQTVFYGAPYQVTAQFKGTQSVKLGEAQLEAERIIVSIKGPASKADIEMLFERDAVRTPVSVRVPVANGSIVLERAR